MDTGTALAAATLMILANGAVLGLMLRRFTPDLRRTAISWQAGTIFIAAGCALFILPSMPPPALALALANGLIMLGLAGYWHALRQFYDYPPTIVPLLPVVAGTLGVFWFAAIDPQIKVRIMIVSVAWMALMGGSAQILTAQAYRDKALSRRMLACLFVVMALLTGVRAIYYTQIEMGSDFSVVDNSSWMNLATAMLEVILPIIGTTAFVLMCSERMRQQLPRTAHPANPNEDAGQAERLSRTPEGPPQHAREAGRDQTETLSYIGHDLRAPLATIMGYTRLLSRTETPEQAQHLRAIERSVSYQLTLVDEILEYAKYELKPLDIRTEAISLAALLDDVVLQADSLSRQRHNRFEFEAGTPLPALVSSDPRRLQQILLNLIANAAKFTSHGLIRLTVSAGAHGRTVVLAFAVTDSGEGIDPQAQASVFEAFEQVRKRPGSAGLGLYISQRIVKNLGGELRLESTPGVGSRFSFNMPVEPLSADTVTLPRHRSAEADAPMSAACAFGGYPPKDICLDLAKFASTGQLSDIEDWLQRRTPAHADHQGFFDEVRDALQVLDFERIEALALAGVNERPFAGP